MPRTRTLTELREECRWRTESEGSQFVSETELDAYINDSIAVLYGKLVRARGDQYYSKTFNATTIPGASTITLPDDFFKLLGVDAKLGDAWRSLEPMDFSQRAYYLNQSSGVATFGNSYVYDLQGNNLVLLPATSAAYAVMVHYVPWCPILALPDDTFDGINGWETYAILDVCITMLNKEESDTRVLMSQRADIEDRIDELAGNRDEGTAWRVQNRYRGRSSRGRY